MSAHQSKPSTAKQPVSSVNTLESVLFSGMQGLAKHERKPAFHLKDAHAQVSMPNPFNQGRAKVDPYFGPDEKEPKTLKEAKERLVREKTLTKNQYERAAACEQEREDLVRKSKEYEQQIENLRAERAKLRANVARADNRAKSIARELENASRTGKVDRDEVVRLRDELRTANDFYSQTNILLSEAEARERNLSTELQDQISMLKNSIKKLEQEKNDLTKERADSIDSKDEMDRLIDMAIKSFQEEDAKDGIDPENNELINELQEARRKYDEEQDDWFREAEDVLEQSQNVSDQTTITLDSMGAIFAGLNDLKRQNALMQEQLESVKDALENNTALLINTIKDKALGFTKQELDKLQTAIAMTNPDEFNNSLIKAVMNNDYSKIQLLLDIGADMYHTTTQSQFPGYNAGFRPALFHAFSRSGLNSTLRDVDASVKTLSILKDYGADFSKLGNEMALDQFRKFGDDVFKSRPNDPSYPDYDSTSRLYEIRLHPLLVGEAYKLGIITEDGFSKLYNQAANETPVVTNRVILRYDEKNQYAGYNMMPSFFDFVSPTGLTSTDLSSIFFSQSGDYYRGYKVSRRETENALYAKIYEFISILVKFGMRHSDQYLQALKEYYISKQERENRDFNSNRSKYSPLHYTMLTESFELYLQLYNKAVEES